MKRRKPRAVPTGAAADLAVYVSAVRAAAMGGDRAAADRLAAAESWLHMLRAAGGDAELAVMFMAFARADEASWVR